GVGSRRLQTRNARLGAPRCGGDHRLRTLRVDSFLRERSQQTAAPPRGVDQSREVFVPLSPLGHDLVQKVPSSHFFPLCHIEIRFLNMRFYLWPTKVQGMAAAEFAPQTRSW